MAASRDLLWVSCGRLVSAVVGLLSIRYATTVLSPSQYGELTLLLSIQAFCGLFLINPVDQHINRQAHAWWSEGTLMSRMAAYRTYVVGSALIGALGASLLEAQAGGVSKILTMLAVFGMVLSATGSAMSAHLLNMLGFRAASVAWASLTVIASFLCALLLVYFVPTALAWFSGQAFGMALGAIGAGRALSRRSQATKNTLAHLPVIDRQTALNYCLPLAVATGFMWLRLSGWRFVMEYYWGLELLGYAAIGLSLASQLWGLAESLAMQFLHPLFYRYISQANPLHSAAVFSDLLNVQGPVYLVLAGATVCGAAALLHLLTHAQYAGAVYFVMLGALVEFCRVLGNVLGNVAQVTRHTRSLAFPYASGALALLTVMLFTGSRHAAIEWAGTALATGGIVMLLAMALSMYRQLEFKLDARRWIIALLCLLLLLLTAFFITAPVDIAESLLQLSAVSVLSGSMILLLLWENPALQRMLAMRLYEEKKA